MTASPPSGVGPHAEALRTLVHWDPPSGTQASLRDAFAEHLRERPDGVLRHCRPDHLTASVLVLDRSADHALLTLHAKAGRWFQLGGHVEATDPSLSAAGLREALEEAGLATVELDPVPVHLDRHDVPFCGGGARHLDVRFVAVADAAAASQVSAESHDVRWWPVRRLPSDEPSLAELVDLGRRRVLGGGAVGSGVGRRTLRRRVLRGGDDVVAGD